MGDLCSWMLGDGDTGFCEQFLIFCVVNYTEHAQCCVLSCFLAFVSFCILMVFCFLICFFVGVFSILAFLWVCLYVILVVVFFVPVCLVRFVLVCWVCMVDVFSLFRVVSIFRLVGRWLFGGLGALGIGGAVSGWRLCCSLSVSFCFL